MCVRFAANELIEKSVPVSVRALSSCARRVEKFSPWSDVVVLAVGGREATAKCGAIVQMECRHATRHFSAATGYQNGFSGPRDS